MQHLTPVTVSKWSNMATVQIMTTGKACLVKNRTSIWNQFTWSIPKIRYLHVNLEQDRILV